MSTHANTATTIIPILMPQAGNSMEEGTILKWRVQPGDRITPGQVLLEVETDKASVDVEATDPGRLARIIAPEGAVVPIKQPIAYLAESDADLDAFLAAEKPNPASPTLIATTSQPSTPAIAAPPTPQPPPSAQSRTKASPAARRLAAEKGLDLSQLPAGSGPGGRILSTELAALQPTSTAFPTHSSPVTYFRQTIDAGPLIALQAQQAAAGATPNDLMLRAVAATLAQLPTHPAVPISNLSHLGIEEFAASIPPNESAILAIGALREGVLASGGVMYARRIMTLTLTIDHRRIDPALAAAFMTKLKQTLESPAQHLA